MKYNLKANLSRILGTRATNNKGAIFDLTAGVGCWVRRLAQQELIPILYLMTY